jgi:alginate O-acetyltransferase complex protein AlgI
MLFNSLEFFVFFILCFSVYWFVFKTKKTQNLFLLVISYFFYGWWDWRFLLLILASSLLDYFIGIKISETSEKPKRKALLFLSLFFNLGALGVFKYYDFFISSLLDVCPGLDSDGLLLNVMLPVGISFYTFQTLSYSLDVYRREIKAERNLVSFAAFVCFFPQLVAGPIERAKDLLPQFEKSRIFNSKEAYDGLQLILWGLFKKSVIADNISPYVDKIFLDYHTYGSGTLLLGAVLFSSQIYCDFSGYSDIAIGTSKLFGFNLSRNFNFPYFSKNITEFWKRWHMSLTNWFKDYIYIPLGGSRVSSIVLIRNIFIVFFVSGIWHGANWTYIFWGSLNGVLFIPVALYNKHFNRSRLLTSKVFDIPKIVLTFLIVSILWVFFRADSIDIALGYVGGLIELEGFTPVSYLKNIYGFITWNKCQYIFPLLLVLYIFEFINRKHQFGLDFKFNPIVKLTLSVFIFLIWFVFSNYPSEDFIYFQF